MKAHRSAMAVCGFALACLSAQAPAQQAPHAVGTAVDATFKAWDADHDGMLSEAEFRNGWASLRGRVEARAEARLRAQFDKVDADNDGALDAAEYGNLLLVRRAGKSAPALASFDGNGDQRLQFDEYLRLVGRLAVAPRAQGRKP